VGFRLGPQCPPLCTINYLLCHHCFVDINTFNPHAFTKWQTSFSKFLCSFIRKILYSTTCKHVDNFINHSLVSKHQSLPSIWICCSSPLWLKFDGCSGYMWTELNIQCVVLSHAIHSSRNSRLYGFGLELIHEVKDWGEGGTLLYWL